MVQKQRLINISRLLYKEISGSGFSRFLIDFREYPSVNIQASICSVQGLTSEAALTCYVNVEDIR